MDIIITINTDNAIFQGDDSKASGEFRYILRHIADASFRWPPQTRNVLDRHGSVAGSMEVWKREK